MNSESNTEQIIETLKKWTEDGVGSPSLLISVDDNSFYVSHYQGMGNSDYTSIDRFLPQYKVVIEQLYREGKLKVSGLPFSLYPDSDRFRKLRLEAENMKINEQAR
ncbi:conserved hypothetical protein [Alteromonas macleodii]|jgi:hypothetical protein